MFATSPISLELRRDIDDLLFTYGPQIKQIHPEFDIDSINLYKMPVPPELQHLPKKVAYDILIDHLFQMIHHQRITLGQFFRNMILEAWPKLEPAQKEAILQAAEKESASRDLTVFTEKVAAIIDESLTKIAQKHGITDRDVIKQTTHYLSTRHEKPS
jgi:hypothetical protein